MLAQEKLKPKAKVWLEYNGNPVVGKGGASILEAIKKEKSISTAARTLGMSYRYVWNYLARMEKVLEKPIIQTYKGGKTGGGAKLTPLGESLLKEYKRVEEYVSEILCNKSSGGG